MPTANSIQELQLIAEPDTCVPTACRFGGPRRLGAWGEPAGRAVRLAAGPHGGRGADSRAARGHRLRAGRHGRCSRHSRCQEAGSRRCQDTACVLLLRRNVGGADTRSTCGAPTMGCPGSPTSWAAAATDKMPSHSVADGAYCLSQTREDRSSGDSKTFRACMLWSSAGISRTKRQVCPHLPARARPRGHHQKHSCIWQRPLTWHLAMLALHEGDLQCSSSLEVMRLSWQMMLYQNRYRCSLRLACVPLPAGPDSDSGCRDRSYARLISDLQLRGAAGVVVGAPGGSDVFQLECRQALRPAVPHLRQLVYAPPDSHGHTTRLALGSISLLVQSAAHQCPCREL